MENLQSPGPKSPENPIRDLAALAAAEPLKTVGYAFTLLGVYFSLFMLTGWFISTLFGQPFWACVGLVFLLRLCFT
jgi:hypothetical protein